MIFNRVILNQTVHIFIKRIMINEINVKLLPLVSRPITVNPNTPLMKIRQILLEHNEKRVIILDKNIPVGVVTEKDIAKKIYDLGTKHITTVKAKDFESKKLFMLTKDNSVKDCARMMKKHRVNLIIIVSKDNKFEGIVTKTDLVKVFLTKESTPISVTKIMKKKVITAAPSDPILYVERLLIKYGISRIIITRNQIPIGVITFRDFVPAKIPHWIAESADPTEVQEYKLKRGLKEDHSTLGYLFPFHSTDIMTVNPITIDWDQDVKTAIMYMIKHNISGLPVVKKSKLVGIITKSDIVNSLAV